jgi:hypothetical protein
MRDEHMISNAPPVRIELDRHLADFVIENCDLNIAFALRMMQALEYRSAIQMLIVNIEQLKKLKLAVQDGINESTSGDGTDGL